jgi:hypothetical protein
MAFRKSSISVRPNTRVWSAGIVTEPHYDPHGAYAGWPASIPRTVWYASGTPGVSI